MWIFLSLVRGGGSNQPEPLPENTTEGLASSNTEKTTEQGKLTIKQFLLDFPACKGGGNQPKSVQVWENIIEGRSSFILHWID